MWQYVKLPEQIRPRDTLTCCWDVEQPTHLLAATHLCSPVLSPPLLHWSQGHLVSTCLNSTLCTLTDAQKRHRIMLWCKCASASVHTHTYTQTFSLLTHTHTQIENYLSPISTWPQGGRRGGGGGASIRNKKENEKEKTYLLSICNQKICKIKNRKAVLYSVYQSSLLGIKPFEFTHPPPPPPSPARLFSFGVHVGSTFIPLY